MTGRAEVIAGVDGVDLSGQTVLVTGATSGIGRETALALARLGARVLVHGRDEDHAIAVTDRLADLGADPAFIPADFADRDAVRSLADAVEARVDDLDVLVNNAGAHYRNGWLTDDGVEATFAVNHLAPFLLTNLLRPTIPDGGRVVTLSSGVHSRAGPADLSRRSVTTVEDYDGLDAYARSKLANILFTVELARRAEDVVANCCHPGFVPGSAIWRDAPLPVKLATGVLSRIPRPLTGGVVASPADGAATPVYLAASPDAAERTGTYFEDCEPARPAAPARDDSLAQALWELSADLVDLDA